jgi:phage baseplate assembly protein W
MAGFAPKLPLKLGTDQGYVLIDDLKTLSNQSFLMLLLTNPGERIMDNNFGIGARRLLFENNSSVLRSSFEQRLRSQVQEYAPYISITNVDFSNSDEDGYLLSVKITYFIVPLGDYANVTINSNGSVISSS